MSENLSSSAPRDARPRPRLFYGWRIVASVFVIMTFASGLGFYNISVILSALIREQGFSVSLASAATAIFFSVSGFAGLGISRLITRYDIRFTIIGGATLAGLSMLAIPHCTQVWQVFVVYAVFGVGFAGSNMVPGATLLTRWFERGRAKALSIASTGLSLGGMLLTPLSASLIIENGLMDAMPYVSAMYLLGIIPVAMLLKPDPASMGLGPDGGLPRQRHEGKAAILPGVPYDAAIHSHFFRICVISYFLIMLAQVGSIAHHFNLVATRLDPGVAATSIMFLAAASAGGRLAGGWFASHYSLRLFSVLLMIGQGSAQFILAGGESATALLIGSALFGLTVGNILMLMPLIFAQAFGLRDYARIYSQGNMISALGMAAGPLAMGATHDWLGGYSDAYVFAGSASLLGALLLYYAGPIPNADD